MISQEQSQDMARTRSAQSARAGQRPFTPWPEDFDAAEAFCRSIPYLGDREHIRAAYGPPMWARADVRQFLPSYRYEWFFVDSSGFGGPNEPAETPSAFVALAKRYKEAANAAGFEVGFGIAEVGQFQVQIAPYLRRLDKKVERTFILTRRE